MGVINLVSTYADRGTITGPGKVFGNLVKGLERIGQPYLVNRTLDSTRWLWIHSDLRALLELPRHGTLNLLGPNLVVLPRDLPTRKTFRRSSYLQPSDWAATMWVQERFSQCPLRVWPAGIDTEEFPERKERRLDAPVLVYYKERCPHELDFVERTLRKIAIPYSVIRYGAYSQSEYIRQLEKCSFVIWLGRHESQGIALQEALAMDVPILVLDAVSIYNRFPPPGISFEHLRPFRTTTAPYFDSSCGLVLYSLDSLEDNLSIMYERLESFSPREFVIENLSLERQARAFVGLFEELELLHGCDETPRVGKDIRPYEPGLKARLLLKAFHVAKRLLRR